MTKKTGPINLIGLLAEIHRQLARSTELQMGQDEEQAPISGEVDKLIRAAWPQVMIQSLNMLKWTFSTMLIGKTLGKDSLAGVSLAILTVNLTGISLVGGLLSAVDTLGPQAYAAKAFCQVGQTTTRGFILCCFALLPWVPVWLNVDTIMLWLGQPAASSELARRFLSTYVYAFPGIVFYESALRFYRVQSIIKPLAIAKAICLLVHIALLHLFASDYGFDGFPIVHIASLYLDCFLVFVMFRWFKLHHPETFPENFSISYIWRVLSNYKATLQFLRLGVPGIFSMGEWWFFEVLCFMAGKFGTLSLAAHYVTYSLIPLLCMWSTGVSTALSIRCGMLLAQQKVSTAKTLAKYAVVGNLLFVTGIAMLVFMFRHVIIKFFTDDPSVAALTLKIWPFFCIVVVQNAFATVQAGILRAMGMQSRMSIVFCISLWFVGLPITYFLAFVLKFNLLGIWLAIPTMYIFLNGSILCSYSSTDWYTYAHLIQDQFHAGEVKHCESPKNKYIPLKMDLELAQQSVSPEDMEKDVPV